ncbi:MAG: hypothetical protein H6737_02160 [Alphaproteobacteria bacterium]|nr:hypothetical protein [Alphaproteobacteria bacterium]
MRRLSFLVIALLLLVPPGWTWHASHRADRMFDGDRAAWLGLADEVARDALRTPTAADFATGSARFDGEWALGTCQMAIVGLGHVIDRFPETRDRYLPAMRACGAHLVDPATLAFGSDAWGERALEAPGFRGHAYLGYVGLALGVLRAHDPAFAHVREHDAIAEGLARQIAERPLCALQTYPGEAYPPDQAVVLAALAHHPGPYDAVLAKGLADFRHVVDPGTGLSFQAVRSDTGEPVDGARGSGAMFAALWLVDVDPALSRALYEAGRDGLFETVGPLGALREHPRGVSGGGDIDSGPLILGYSISATGFALAPARAFGDRATFRALYRSSHLFGLAHPTPRGWRYATGFSLGNAILLAAMTAAAP